MIINYPDMPEELPTLKKSLKEIEKETKNTYLDI